MDTDQEFYNNLLAFSGKIATLFMLLPLIFYLKNRRRQQTYNYIYFWLLVCDLVVSLIEQLVIFSARNSQLFRNYIHSIGIDSTNFIIILSYLYGYLLTGFFIKKILPNNIGNLIFYLSIFLTINAVYIYFFVDGYNNIATVNQTISRVYQIVVSIIAIHFLVDKNLDKEIFKDSYFLICLAILLPTFISTLISIYSGNIYQTNFILFVKISIFRNIVNLISIFLAIKAFYKPAT